MNLNWKIIQIAEGIFVWLSKTRNHNEKYHQGLEYEFFWNNIGNMSLIFPSLVG